MRLNRWHRYDFAAAHIGKYLALFGFIGGVLSVLVFGYIAVYLDVHAGWKLGFLEEAVLLMALPFGVNAWKLAQKK